MNLSAVDLTTLYILTMDIVLSGFLLELLKRTGASSTLIFVTGLVFAGWLAVLYLGLSGHWLFPSDIGGFSFFVVVILGVIVVSGVMLFFPPIKKHLFAAPQELLLLPQGLRMFLGAGWLMESSLGIMPKEFGIADGITHITAAFLALKAGILYARGDRSRGGLWFANLFGLLDIVVVALGISFVMLKEITPYHNVMYAVFFVAPIFIGLHFVSLVKLATNKSEGARQ
ncbi:MAG: hypothetical protein HYR79_02650 [Nitrospirae bacterium]|nr:hypothetical protein [Nitrospirota bacterium]